MLSTRLAWMHAGSVALALAACVIVLLRGRRSREQSLAETERSLAASQLRAAQAEAMATRAGLAEISARLNPHFLANAMHSVSALIEADPPAAEAAIDRIGDLFRQSVQRSEQPVVRLEDEWNFVRDYLSIEQLRLGDRLRVVMEFDPSLADIEVPTYVLQPLVENAIRHGIAPKPSGGTVMVRAARRDSRLVLEVSDDGAGADPDRLAATTGTGLRTLRQRLALDPDARGSFDVETARGEGFRACITLHL